MPLDASEAMTEPLFLQRITIIRRTETIGTNGRAIETPYAITPRPWGVVLPVDTAIGGNALERTPDAQYRGAAFEIHSRFRIRGPSPGYEPDVFFYNGDYYVVTIVNDYSQYGRGFIKAEVSSTDPIDNPPPEGWLP